MLCLPHLHVWRAVVTYSACVVWCHGPQLATTGREKPVSPMGELATQWAGREEGREERVEDEAGTRQGDTGGQLSRTSRHRRRKQDVWLGRGLGTP